MPLTHSDKTRLEKYFSRSKSLNKPAGLNITAEAWEKAIVAIGKANVAGASQSQIMAVLTKAGLTPQEAKEVWAAYDVLTDSRLSAICDRELARVGLAEWSPNKFWVWEGDVLRAAQSTIESARRYLKPGFHITSENKPDGKVVEKA
jgi:hypothetical protein